MKRRRNSLFSIKLSRVTLLLGLAASLTLLSVPVSALSDIQKRIFDVDVQQYDKERINAKRGSTGGGGTLTGGCNAEQIWNFLMGKTVQGKVLDAQLVAGIMGNMQAESAFFPNRIQGRPPEQGSDDANDAGSGGYGLVQWTPGSKIIADFDRIRVDPAWEPPITLHSDMRFQLTLLLDQLNGISPTLSEAGAGRDLAAQTTTRGAASSFMTKFERPRDQSQTAQTERGDLAEGVFNRGTSGQWDCQNNQ